MCMQSMPASSKVQGCEGQATILDVRQVLDITGGAPELNEHFQRLVQGACAVRATGRELRIIDRCNLTVGAPGMTWHDMA